MNAFSYVVNVEQKIWIHSGFATITDLQNIGRGRVLIKTLDALPEKLLYDKSWDDGEFEEIVPDPSKYVYALCFDEMYDRLVLYEIIKESLK